MCSLLNLCVVAMEKEDFWTPSTTLLFFLLSWLFYLLFIVSFFWSKINIVMMASVIFWFPIFFYSFFYILFILDYFSPFFVSSLLHFSVSASQMNCYFDIFIAPEIRTANIHETLTVSSKIEMKGSPVAHATQICHLSPRLIRICHF